MACWTSLDGKVKCAGYHCSGASSSALFSLVTTRSLKAMNLNGFNTYSSYSALSKSSYLNCPSCDTRLTPTPISPNMNLRGSMKCKNWYSESQWNHCPDDLNRGTQLCNLKNLIKTLENKCNSQVVLVLQLVQVLRLVLGLPIIWNNNRSCY